MEDNLDEKKCPVCGRPNLNKAEKCWYCQSALGEESESKQNSLLSEEELLDQSGGGSSFVKSSLDENAGNSKSDTPEWLRKVRELISAEQVVEEPDDEWQQQHLFDTSAKDKKSNPSLQNKKSVHVSNEMELKNGSVDPGEKHHLYEQKEPDEELPDGFTHLSTHLDD